MALKIPVKIESNLAGKVYFATLGILAALVIYSVVTAFYAAIIAVAMHLASYPLGALGTFGLAAIAAVASRPVKFV